MDIKIHLYTCVYLLATTTLHIKAIIYVISNATKQKQERQNKHFKKSTEFYKSKTTIQ